MTASVSSAGSDKRMGGFKLLAKARDHVVLLGLSRHAVAAGDLADLDAVTGCAVFDDQFFERRAHTRFRSRFVGVSLFGERGLFDQLKDLFQRGWRFGRVHNRFDLGFKTH